MKALRVIFLGSKLCEKKAKNAQKTGQDQGHLYTRRPVTYKMSIIYLYRGHQELSISAGNIW